MRLKTGIAVLSANALLVLLVGQEIRGEASREASRPLPLVQASVTVAEPPDPVVVEGALSSNTRGWAHASEAAASATENGVRPELVDAYSLAVAASPLGCHLTVSLLAAIGQVESGNLVGHGLDSEHRAVPAILGPVLDGQEFAAIEDTDDGELDGDKAWDRAVGPMQFIPASWRVAGVDMDGDGRRDPQDVDDAAGAAMVYLCSGGRDLATEDGLHDAVMSYNRSAAYLRLVLAWKAVFDRNPLIGWAALPVLAAWEQPPLIPAELSLPATATDSPQASLLRNARPATPATPGTSRSTTLTTTTPTLTPGARGAPTTGAPNPTRSSTTPSAAATPGTPGTPATEPDATTDATTGPTTDATTGPTTDATTTGPLPTCPVPTPVDPAVTPSPTPTTGDTTSTPTADIPGDGTDRPVECVPPIDPETGLPLLPVPEPAPSTEPDARSAD